MVAGHFTTALIAKQWVPSGHIAFYLIAAQLMDLLWLVFHYLGLEVTHPDNFMDVTLDKLMVDMTYSHDLLPVLGWAILIVVAGRLLFRAWLPGWVGGLLVLAHAVTDYVGAYEHFVFGPDSQVVSTGLYYSAPYLAVSLELLFILGTMFWVVRKDAKDGIRQSRGVWAAWTAVFVGGTIFMFIAAGHSIAELLDTTPSMDMAGTTIPVLAFIYISMIWGLIWADTQKTKINTQLNHSITSKGKPHA